AAWGGQRVASIRAQPWSFAVIAPLQGAMIPEATRWAPLQYRRPRRYRPALSHERPHERQRHHRRPSRQTRAPGGGRAGRVCRRRRRLRGVLGVGGRRPRRGSPDVALWPGPLIDLGLVHTELVGVVLAVDLHVAQLLLDVGAAYLKTRHPIDDVDGDAEAVDLVLDGQIERRVDVALLFVAAHVHVSVIGTAVGQPMDQPRIAVGVEDDRLVPRGHAVENSVPQAAWGA